MSKIAQMLLSSRPIVGVSLELWLRLMREDGMDAAAPTIRFIAIARAEPMH